MDPVYKPTNQDELELFVEKQKFMYDVFIGTLKTSMGQHFVHAHEATGDAQAVWRDYSSYMRTSTSTDMELEDLLSLITSEGLKTLTKGPPSSLSQTGWNTSGFMKHWSPPSHVFLKT